VISSHDKSHRSQKFHCAETDDLSVLQANLTERVMTSDFGGGGQNENSPGGTPI